MSLEVDPWGGNESYEQYPSDRYEQNLPTFYSSGEALDAYGNRGDLKSTQEAADLVFGAIFEGTAGKTSLPATMLDMFGGSLDSLQSFIEDVPILGDLAEIFTGNPDSDLNDIGSWVNNILSLLGLSKSQAATPGLDLVGAATDFIQNILNPTGQLTSIGVVNEKIAASQALALAAVGAQGVKVEAVKASMISIQDGLPLQKFSHSMTNSEMTFDRDMFIVETTATANGTVSSTTGQPNTSAVENHTHTIGSRIHAHTFSIGQLQTVPKDTVYGGFIRTSWGGLRESFTYAVGAGSSPCSLEVVVFQMSREEGTAGQITCLWASPDQTPIIGNTPGEFTPDIPEGLILPDRTDLFLAIHQYGTGNARQVWGINIGGPDRQGLLYPAKSMGRFGYSSKLVEGNTFEAGALLFDTTFKPWLGIGPSLNIPLPGLVVIFEPFDDNVIPPTLQKSFFGQPARIVDGNFVFSGTTDGEALYTATTTMNRDNHFVEAGIAIPVTAQPQRLYVRSGVALKVNNTGVSIQRGSSGTVLATAAVVPAVGDVLRLIANGNVFTVNKMNGETVVATLCQYVDTANAIPKGSSNRLVQLSASRAFPGVNSGGWTYFRAQDIPDPE
ncbi:hypothetical protein CH274_13135 [Rhodococcus sp. 06-418-5]|uniref:hypothetical protein n=1 Tax=Rhodococcus sp. 06-418-5 TaxID=2022507 RepID=UPI000B9B4E63|nr:hypothetical protein [Rhodococcus sp. 06-418-5]OZC80175.1 hypothetical protein CH274_13135 [Rhodococcus sp. 06-418-5]